MAPHKKLPHNVIEFKDALTARKTLAAKKKISAKHSTDNEHTNLILLIELIKKDLNHSGITAGMTLEYLQNMPHTIEDIDKKTKNLKNRLNNPNLNKSTYDYGNSYGNIVELRVRISRLYDSLEKIFNKHSEINISWSHVEKQLIARWDHILKLEKMLKKQFEMEFFEGKVLDSELYITLIKADIDIELFEKASKMLTEHKDYPKLLINFVENIKEGDIAVSLFIKARDLMVDQGPTFQAKFLSFMIKNNIFKIDAANHVLENYEHLLLFFKNLEGEINTTPGAMTYLLFLSYSDALHKIHIPKRKDPEFVQKKIASFFTKDNIKRLFESDMSHPLKNSLNSLLYRILNSEESLTLNQISKRLDRVYYTFKDNLF